MPYKDIRKRREAIRKSVAKLRAQRKGITSVNPPKGFTSKPENVNPKPCPRCQEFETLKKAYENLCQKIANTQEKKRALWRQQKRKQYQKKKAQPKQL